MKRLKELRQAKNVTQIEMSKLLGVERTTYTKYETGDREPDIKTLKKLADYFSTTVSYIIGEIDSPLTIDGVDSTKKELTIEDLFSSNGINDSALADYIQKLIN